MNESATNLSLSQIVSGKKHECDIIDTFKVTTEQHYSWLQKFWKKGTKKNEWRI